MKEIILSTQSATNFPTDVNLLSLTGFPLRPPYPRSFAALGDKRGLSCHRRVSLISKTSDHCKSRRGLVDTCQDSFPFDSCHFLLPLPVGKPALKLLRGSSVCFWHLSWPLWTGSFSGKRTNLGSIGESAPSGESLQELLLTLILQGFLRRILMRFWYNASLWRNFNAIIFSSKRQRSSFRPALMTCQYKQMLLSLGQNAIHYCACFFRCL